MCELWNQDSQGAIQSESDALRSWGANCAKPSPSPKARGKKCQEENQERWSLMSQGRRRWKSQLKRRAIHPSVPVKSSVDWMRHTCIVRPSSSCSSTIQMLNSSRNSLTDIPRNVLPALWASLSKSGWLKTNHHNMHVWKLSEVVSLPLVNLAHIQLILR